jgi:hypothetical protein
MRPLPALPLIASALLLSSGMVFAQAGDPPKPYRDELRDQILPWLEVNDGETVKLALANDPRRTRKCHVASMVMAKVTCSRRFGRDPVVYRQQEIVAVIRPGTHDNPMRDFIACEAVAGGIITGAVFLGMVAFPAGLFGAVPIGLLGVSGIGLCGMMFDDGTAPTQTAPQVLYLAPGRQLQVALK